MLAVHAVHANPETLTVQHIVARLAGVHIADQPREGTPHRIEHPPAAHTGTLVRVLMPHMFCRSACGRQLSARGK